MQQCYVTCEHEVFTVEIFTSHLPYIHSLCCHTVIDISVPALVDLAAFKYQLSPAVVYVHEVFKHIIGDTREKYLVPAARIIPVIVSA